MTETSPRKFSTNSLRVAFDSMRWPHRGKVLRVVGNLLEVILPGCQVGTILKVEVPGRRDEVLGEVVGFKDESLFVLPYTHLNSVSPGCLVQAINTYTKAPCSSALLGRVVDPFLSPLSGGPIEFGPETRFFDIDHKAPNPLEREIITKPLALGIRAIDGLLTFGAGQRIGIMAGSGVGKSVMMGMIAKHSEADVNVIALLGERGREVREFIEHDLGEAGLAKSVVVAVTSDQSPLMRVRGAKVATTIAEYFSAQGKSVLLMMDSLTRVAMAQREIGNAGGEPPTTKGYTPSVFSLLPALLERTGPQKKGRGAISGLYTVLVDGDDFNDPIADAARSILDGHINLSRELANKGHFPAIDVSTSSSRVMGQVVAKEHWQLANRIKEFLGVHRENFDLVQTGSYMRGSNPKLDQALNLMPAIEHYLRQDVDEISNYSQAVSGLLAILQGSFQGTRHAVAMS